MEMLNIPDYKLDHGFLKEFTFAVLKNPMQENLTVLLPVFVQVTRIDHGVDGWNYYFVTDGEYELIKCTFVSKQAMPEQFSILKISKISNLPLDVRNLINGSHVHLGEIEFDVEVSGENIGYSLYMDQKYINFEELIEIKSREGPYAFFNPDKFFGTSKTNNNLPRYMWENRSEKFCDVKFTFENEQGVVVYAHKSALMSISDVFIAHFENEGFIDNKSLHLIDTNSYSFTKFLEFVYMRKVQLSSGKLAFEVLYLSEKYLVPQLKKVCQWVIKDYCHFMGENLLKVLHENHKVNDQLIKRYITNVALPSQIRDVLTCGDFLNCDFSTVLWILSNSDLMIDEWSLLCAVYRWACHNGIHAFCHKMEHRMDHNLECLHEILEHINFEMIDMISLKRFFKLPKLEELVNVDELEKHIFDGLLEHPSYFEQYGMATNGYSKYRGVQQHFVLAEIIIGPIQETRLKDIRVEEGPVLGFKVKVETKDFSAGDYSLDMWISFQYLYSLAQVDDGAMHINIRAIPSQSRVKKLLTFLGTKWN